MKPHTHQTSTREQEKNLEYDNNFLDITPKVWSTKKKFDKPDFIKIKFFYPAKDNEDNEKSYRLEKIFADDTSW